MSQSNFNNNLFPSLTGFHFPAEWAKHTATWLSWPHKEASWPGKMGMIYGKYMRIY
jgi:agmatine deiminase